MRPLKACKMLNPGCDTCTVCIWCRTYTLWLDSGWPLGCTMVELVVIRSVEQTYTCDQVRAMNRITCCQPVSSLSLTRMPGVHLMLSPSWVDQVGTRHAYIIGVSREHLGCDTDRATIRGGVLCPLNDTHLFGISTNCFYFKSNFLNLIFMNSWTYV